MCARNTIEPHHTGVAACGWMTTLFSVAGLVLVFGYFFWIASHGRGWATLAEHPPHPVRYDLLARAFEAGQLHLIGDPNPNLLALSDPYDPGLNPPHAPMYDATLFGGKYYLYFGPVPALLLHLPSRVFFGLEMSDPVAAWLLACFGILGVLLVLTEYARDRAGFGWRHPAVWGVTLLAVSNGFAFELESGAIYQVAIFSGIGFAVWSIYFAVRALRFAAAGAHVSSAARIALALSSGCAVLALGSRPLLVVCVAVPIWAALLITRNRTLAADTAIADRVKTWAVALVPWLAGVGALMEYNHARFGSFTEWGNRFTLSAVMNVPKNVRYFAPDAFFSNLYGHLLRPLGLKDGFPWFTFDPSTPAWVPPPVGYYYVEPSAGVVGFAPFVIFVVIGVWGAVRAAGRPRSSSSAAAGEPPFALQASLLLGFLVLGELLVQPALTARYVIDHLTYFLLAAVLSVDWACLSWRRRFRIGLGVAAAIVGALTLWVGFGLGMQGSGDRFMSSNPEGYWQVAAWFGKSR